MADNRKAEKLKTAVAKLNDTPTSPRKMRLVVDIVRGVEVNKALDILQFSKKDASVPLGKLIRSALSNWQAKNPDQSIDDAKLCVKEIFVDEGKTLKRIRTAPQGRAARIRKRSNHVTVVLGTKIEKE